MFFRIQLESGKSMVGLVALDGNIMYRLVDVGRLLDRLQPYTFAKKYKGRYVRQYIPESLHGHYNHMVLRSDLVTFGDVKVILMKYKPDLAHHLTHFFQEGRIMLEDHCYNNYSIKYCMVLKECQQGGEKLGDFLRGHKSRVVQLYRESIQHCTHAKSAGDMHIENTMPDNEGYDTNESVGQECNEDTKEECSDEISEAMDNGVKDECANEISEDNGESVQNNVPDPTEISVEESVHTDETNDARMEISVDGHEQLIQIKLVGYNNWIWTSSHRPV